MVIVVLVVVVLVSFDLDLVDLVVVVVFPFISFFVVLPTNKITKKFYRTHDEAFFFYIKNFTDTSCRNFRIRTEIFAVAGTF